MWFKKKLEIRVLASGDILLKEDKFYLVTPVGITQLSVKEKK